MLARLFARFLSDERVIKHYVAAGAIFGEAVSYLGHGECIGFKGRLDDYATWEREIIRRGYVPYSVDQLTAYGGYDLPLPPLRKAEPDEEVSSHAEFYRDNFLGKVKPAVDLAAMLSGIPQAVWGTWRQPSTEHLPHSHDPSLRQLKEKPEEDGYTTPGWYFVDEIHHKVFGPFTDPTTATGAYRRYRRRGTDADPWRTQPELDVIRDEIEEGVAPHGHSAGDSCADCAARFDCKYVFDPYNTNGDCLAEK